MIIFFLYSDPFLPQKCLHHSDKNGKKDRTATKSSPQRKSSLQATRFAVLMYFLYCHHHLNFQVQVKASTKQRVLPDCHFSLLMTMIRIQTHCFISSGL